MPSKIVAFHERTENYAVLQDESGGFWIGEYNQYLTHQNGEPMYVFMMEVNSQQHGENILFMMKELQWIKNNG